MNTNPYLLYLLAGLGIGFFSVIINQNNFKDNALKGGIRLCTTILSSKIMILFIVDDWVKMNAEDCWTLQ